MNTPWSDLGAWLVRARPSRVVVAKALISGTVASLTNLSLFVGAPYLLFYSASHRHLVAGGTLAILLIVIELLAFVRSPLRFVERMTSHELGLSSVTTWRRWLTLVIGSWPYQRWSDASSGDLLERALTDTDVLQDLWLRMVIPFISSSVSMFLGDLVIIVWRPSPVNSVRAVVILVAIQVGFVVILASQLSRMVSIDRRVRSSRAARAAGRLDMSGAARDLEFLGNTTLVSTRMASAHLEVAHVESHRDAHRHLLQVVVIAAPLITLGILGVLNARGASVQALSGLIILLVAVSSGDFLSTTYKALQVGVAVTASTERLSELSSEVTFGHGPWPTTESVDITGVSWSIGDERILHELNLSVANRRRIAISGKNGAGKSTLLRLIARLEEIGENTISIGGCDLRTIDERALRRHLGYVGAEPAFLLGVVDHVIRAGRSCELDIGASLALVGLEAHVTQRWLYLSRGEAQRAALIRGTLLRPLLIILDEPTSALGDEERSKVLAWLEQLSATVIIATHDPVVMAWCDENYELANGQLARISR